MKAWNSCLVLMLIVGSCYAEEETLQLNALKDTFGRSYARNANRGISEYLVISSSPAYCSIVAFDLSEVTNTIVDAEFGFYMRDTLRDPVRFSVAVMVHNDQNSRWSEGSGGEILLHGDETIDIQKGEAASNLYAREGECTYQWLAFRNTPWVGKSGKAARNLGDRNLWLTPQYYSIGKNGWTEGKRFSCSMLDIGLLEEIRQLEMPVVTFGIWGLRGKGIYLIHSRESGRGPELNITVELPEEHGTSD